MTKKLEAQAAALKELEEEVIAKSTPNANGARDFEVFLFVLGITLTGLLKKLFSVLSWRD